jgi:small subunit ribosomal protein S16
MVVKIRLQRFGRVHAPFYRMVAARNTAPRDGKFIELLGTYNPMPTKSPGRDFGYEKPKIVGPGGDNVKEIRLKTDRLRYWLSVGAQPTDRVAWILGKFGILPPPPPRFSINRMIPKKDRVKKEE